ncbi:hypothetical protein CK203_001562 [Vitis vinifera]|uniref:Uncharacterized protein n=1 Tax=Vitis vinifera TaxID=29760 RepID=A0A438KM45_VITVI|nr:hypothetical protein CK203_001562 [Vitis vinifera]
MGQAFRRASGSVRRADLDPSSSSHLKNVGDRRPPVVPVDKVGVSKTRDDIGSGSSGKNFLLKGAPRFNSENVLEERDPQYDAMLSQMVGRIRSKSGGRLEMGEVLKKSIDCLKVFFIWRVHELEVSNSSYLTQKGLRQIQLGQVIPSSANTLNLASNLVSLSKSNVYFLCDTKITSFDLANSIPEKYLKVRLIAPYRSLAVWDSVEERMRKKLARWKSQYISKGGRITLIRSTLASMSIYFMSMLSMPRKSLSILNKALLCKWSWRFAIEREAFWNQVIKGKYGEEQGGWSSKEARGGYGMGCGKLLGRNGEVVRSRLFFVVGNGQRDAWVKDVWRCNEGGGSWSPLFFRPFNDWELDEWVMPATTIKEMFSGWNGTFVGKKGKGVWRASPLCLFGRFGRQGTKLLLRKKSYQFKGLSLLLAALRALAFC